MNQSTDTRAAPDPATGRPRRLTRRLDGKIFGGVAGGLASYFGLDPTLVRVGFALGGLFTGIGVIAYLIMWLVVPAEGRPDEGSSGRLVVALAIAAAAAAVFAFSWRQRGDGWALAILFAAAGLALWKRDDPDGDAGPSPSHQGDPVAVTAQQPAAPATEPAGTGATMPPAATEIGDGDPSPPRPGGGLGRLTVGVCVLLVGVAALLDNLGVWRATVPTVLAGLLIVIGTGLLIGTWWGRARSLVVPGLLLAFVVLLSGVGRVELSPRVGEINERPTRLADVQPGYQLGAGELYLDFRNVDFRSSTTIVRASVGLGEINVVVPHDVRVVVNAQAGAGELNLFGSHRNGVDVRSRATMAPLPSPDGRREPSQQRAAPASGDGGLLKLNLFAGVGHITVGRMTGFGFDDGVRL